MDSGSIDHWRHYFRSATGNIFDVIENAIEIAALDFPQDFKIRRDGIAEKLFLCQLIRCAGCSGVEVVVPNDNENGNIQLRSVGSSDVVEGKGSTGNSSVDDNGDVNLNYTSNYCDQEAEELAVEIEEESKVIGEVLRIKELLSKCEDQSEGITVESLRRLQLMSLSVEILKATKIGMAVNNLRKHKSKRISNIARMLIKDWKDLVDQCLKAVPIIKDEDGSPDSVNPSGDEGGLPSPPLDEGAFLVTQTTSMELSQFFDGMDDDGNIRHSGEYKGCENERRPTLQNPVVSIGKIEVPHEANMGTKRNEKQDTRKNIDANKQTEVYNADRRPARPPKSVSRPKANDSKVGNNLERVGTQKMLLSCQGDISNCLNGETNQMKLEAAKRKLYNGHQQAADAKKQRRQ